jgi:hypothetical protein
MTLPVNASHRPPKIKQTIFRIGRTSPPAVVQEHRL